MIVVFAAGARAADYWDFHTVDTASGMANQVSIAFGPLGELTVAYDANDGAGRFLKFAAFDGTAWSREIVAPGGYAISLAYSPDGSPSISHVHANKLYYVKKSGGSSWTSTLVEKRPTYQINTSLAYDPSGRAVISYVKTSKPSPGLYIAFQNGTSWTTELVEANRAQYNSLGFTPAGDAFIAYNDDIDGNGSLDTLKVARSSGSGWEVTVLEDSYALFVNLAISPITGHPAVATRGASTQPRYFYWDGVNWFGPELVDVSVGVNSSALDFAPNGTPYLACHGEYSPPSADIRLAHRDASGIWSYEIVDAGNPGFLSHNALKFGPNGLPVIGYHFKLSPSLGSLRIAIKTSP